MRLLFGGVMLDTEARQILRGTEPVPLSPKAFDLLACLVENRPAALSKDMLHDRLWPGTFVSDTNLAGLVAEVRRALGDDARTPRYVRTVQRFGYAFAGTVKVEAAEGGTQPTASCWLARGNRRIPLVEGENILGRDAVGSPLDSESVSRRHAKVTVEGAGAYLEDLGSKNGTFLSGRPVRGRTRLLDGDPIAFGAISLVFRTPAGRRSTRTWKKRRQTK